MKLPKAFAPGNISCIFVIKKGKIPATSGSLGLGFTVNKGVFATIMKINNAGKSQISSTNFVGNKKNKNKIMYEIWCRYCHGFKHWRKFK